MKKKIISILLLLSISVGTLSLSSCYLLNTDGIAGLLNGNDKEPEKNPTYNVNGGDEYDVTINASDGVNVVAANKALLSAVSIYAVFEKTSYGKPTQYSSAGSGVIYKLDKTKGDAYVITNYHVVYSTTSSTANKISNDISVFLYGQEGSMDYAIPATYVGGSMQYDLAILKISASTLLMESNARAADFANSDDIAVLDTAIAIGNPEGEGISATLGYVNVDSEYIDMVGADNETPINLRVIRTDAAVNHGNSGGGLFNTRGELIGIVNAKIVNSSVDGIGYAIPSNVAKNISDNIIHYCDGTDRESVFRCMLGITVESVKFYTEYDNETGKVKKCETVKINAVEESSAVKGKLLASDILLSITVNGEKTDITRRHHVIDAMLTAREGNKIVFSIIRGDKEMTVEHTVTKNMLIEYK